MEFHPLTPDRWDDLEKLFGERGAYGGCWCMWWRTTRKEFERGQGAGNRAALKAIVESGEAPGILAYLHGEPVGWCAVAPREVYGSLDRSPVLKRLDDTPVWSIVCFFVSRTHRGSGITEALTRAAVEHVRERGGTMIEAYPTAPKDGEVHPLSSFMGMPAVFERCGFLECARPSKAKIVMRREVQVKEASSGTT
jgi:GNAT superfamily N-acetyltransferase